ncbi:MAG: autotransporter-associated beta strand repeat-containing protein [Akkermansia sp.]|nr:autotransporter-associated beta strand repeat-containing protein [Akkermansia sp.]
MSLLATVAGITTASASETYSADGVNLDNILQSTRFYDTGKGLYWGKSEYQPYRGAKELYGQSGSFEFLDELQSRIIGTLCLPSAFDNLVNDAYSCWYCVGANIIQYWESYYGVFYKGDAPLPYGYTYDTANLSTLAGTQSLELHMAFYDSWTGSKTIGGDGEMSIVWYLATGENIREGKSGYSQLKKDAPYKGGYFAEYFSDYAAAREAYYMGSDDSDLISVTDFLKEAFGYDKKGNRATYGQIAYVGILSPSAGATAVGHALTCYGFTLGKDGLLESLYLANSDDREYEVFQVYVGMNEEGFLHLYEDSARTKDWKWSDTLWNICDITYINTPTILREMYDEYTNAPLTWTGALSTWSGTDAAKATTKDLPGKDSGWQVYAMDDYYASYYQDGREVVFNDLASQKNVNLKGALSTPALHLDNNASDYTFTGVTGTSLQADAIIKQGAGRAAFTKAALNAETVSVGMGTLSLGANAPLTAQSGVVDNLGTLELAAGGNATFTDDLTIRDSGTLAVMGSAALTTTTLTLQEGSNLYFNIGGGNTGSPLLTLDGNLNVLGDCSLTLNETALTSGQSYILMNVSGSVTGWSDITTNCGTITLIGKQLKLAYKQPGSLTWTGGSNTWSSSKWDGKDTTSADKDVTFSRTGTTTITVQGTVSPHSMAFTQDTYTLAAGTGAAISGCRTITLGSGATVTSQVDLAGADVSLGGNSKLTMSLQAASGTLGGLEMAEGSTLTLGGSTRYTVEKAGALNGTIQLNNTAALQLQTAMDTDLYGAINGNANTQLALTNSSTADDVTYYMGNAPTGFLGTIAVGTDKETHRTTLRLNDASHKFTLNKSGELSLRGNGSVTGTINGTGTLTIERNANYQLAPRGTAAFGSDILLNVEGTALIGTAETPITAGLPEKVAVSGNLTTYYKSPSGVKPLALGELVLQDGGSYTLVHTERTLYSSHTIDKLTVDGGGSLTNSIMDVETEVNPQFRHDIIVNTLSGSGTLDLETSSDLYVTKTIIKDTASGGYGGDIVIHNPHYNKMDYYANYDHGQVVEMQSGTINGVVRLEAHGMVSDDSEKTQFPLTPYGLAGFGVGGNITVKGLDDTESSKTTYLYSGSYSAACATKDISRSFANNIAPEKHTLTINAAEDYEFRGQVFAWLSLVKQGRGTQTFSGDTSEFEGGLRVDAGELVFEKGIFSAESVTLNGGTLRLHGGKLAGLGGDGGTLALDAAADGKAYDIDLTESTGSYAVQLNGATAHVTASGAFGGSITATGTSGITVDSDKKLTLQSAISNRGTLTLKGTIDVSMLAIDKNDDTHVDTSGKMGDSGFAKKAGIAVTVVTGGGTTVDNGVTITHKDWQGDAITLGRDGKAGTGGEVDYTSYLLTGTDTATVSAIVNAAKAHSTTLNGINVEGGKLTVDAATDLISATGGKLDITTTGTVGGTAKDTDITATAGTLNTALSGNSSITAKGNVAINRANTHTGNTAVINGKLHIGDKDALGTGEVTLTNGTLEIAADGFANTITAGAASGITVVTGSTLALTDAIDNSGTLTLKGAFDASALKLEKGADTHVDIYGKTGKSGFAQSGGYSVTLVNGGTTANGGASITHRGLTSGTLTLGTDGKATAGGKVNYTTYLLTGTDTATVSDIVNAAKAHSTTLNGINVEGGTLTVDAATDKLHATGGYIEVTRAVNVGGSISGAKVTASAGTISATISGSKQLVVNKGSRVTLSGNNTYTGGTGVYTGGVLRVTNANALGTGEVLLSCGTLEIAANGVGNKITTSCSGSVLSVENDYTLALTEAIKNEGTVTLKGEFNASALKLSDGETTHEDVNGNTGASGFAKTSGRSVTIVTGGTTKNGGTTITHSGLKSGEKLTLGTDGKATTGDGVVDRTSYLLTGTDSASVSAITKAAGGELKNIDVQGGTLVMDAATDKLTVAGGTLDIREGLASSVTLADTCNLTKTGAGTLTIAQASAKGSGSITLKEGTLDLNGKDISSKGVTVTGAAALTSNGGTVKALTLATAGGADGRNGELLYAEELKLTGNLKTAGLTLTKGNITGGSITATGASTVQQGYIGTGITGTTLTKTGDKRVELGGRNKFTGGVTVQQGALALLEKSGMEANITVNSGASLFTAITVNGDITLQNGAIMRLRPGSTYKLQHNLIFSGGSFHGDLSTDAGGTLSLQKGGTLNGSLTLGGGELVYYGGNSPLTVTGTLTLSKATTLTMTGDLVKGKTYTLFKCNDIVKPTAFDPAAFFANPDVVVNVTSTDITATYNGETVHSSTPSSLVREPEPEETEEAVGEDLPTRNALMATTAPAGTPSMSDGELTKVEAPVIETLAAGVADALVQADWGIVNAQRAFTGSLNGRHQSLRALGTGRTAVWADAIGSHTRQSSAHGHAGSDNTLYGAALGVEFNAGAHGAAGVAIGHTWDRVNTFGMSRVKQDTQHAGAFGRARVFSRGANSLWLEAAAGYGKTDSRGTLGYSRERWTQNSGTLTVHANDVMYISETTALNYFGGLEYTATDSGRIDDVRTGSVQNLRGEIGAGVTHAIGHGTVFAEAALTGDMVRHNPTAGVDMRRGGANPGRIGASITVGGAYAITDHWSVNATYSFEGAKHNNSHNAGIGATLRF